MNTTEQRRQAVEQMNASFAIEDMEPTAADVEMQKQYIAGTITIEGMLAQAHAMAAKAKEGKS